MRPEASPEPKGMRKSGAAQKKYGDPFGERHLPASFAWSGPRGMRKSGSRPKKCGDSSASTTARLPLPGLDRRE